jgi:hypothetical protein
MASGEILRMGTPDEIRQEAPAHDSREATIEDAFVAIVQSHQPKAP